MSEETTSVETAAAVAETTATGTEAAATTAPAAAEAPKVPAYSDLLGVISDEKAREFAKRYATLEDLAKGALDLRKLSSQREGWLKVPDDKATDEDKAAWRKALGIPDGPESYGVTVAEEVAKEDPDFADRLGRFLKAMHETGAPKGVVDKALAFQLSEIQAVKNREIEAAKAARDQGERELRARWGADYETYIGYYPRTVLHFGGEEVANALQSAGLDNDPRIVEMFVKIGRMTAESVPAIAAPATQRQSDLAAIEAEARERRDKGTYTDPEFQKRYDAALARAYA